MSGAEIVGLLASASQLAVYSVIITNSISEIYRQVQDAPRRIQQHMEHVTQLADTAQLIEQHHSLQMINTDRQIRTTLKQVKTLSAILDQITSDYAHGSIRNYWKILKGKTEKEIIANLDQLEKKKSSLRLCISLVHTDLLGNTQGGLGKLVEELMTLMPKKAGLTAEAVGGQKQLRKSFIGHPESNHCIFPVLTDYCRHVISLKQISAKSPNSNLTQVRRSHTKRPVSTPRAGR